MLYLIRSFGRNGKSILKVGFSDNKEQRMSNYYHSNPLFEQISFREGNEIKEKKLQLYLNEYKCNFLNEWFNDNIEILQLFHNSWSKINKWIWKNRDNLFINFDDPRCRKIYEELKYIYKGYDPVFYKIDKEYSILSSKELIYNLTEEYRLMDEEFKLYKYKPKRRKRK